MKKILVMAMALVMAVAAIAAQCAGITKKGTRCKRQASPGAEYCWQHGGTTADQRAAGVTAEDGRCKAKTQDGEQCKRNAKPGSKFCWQHQGAEVVSEAREEPAPAAGAQPKKPAASDGRCTAVNKNGTRCSRKAKPGSDKCWQHGQ